MTFPKVILKLFGHYIVRQFFVNCNLVHEADIIRIGVLAVFDFTVCIKIQEMFVE